MCPKESTRNRNVYLVFFHGSVKWFTNILLILIITHAFICVDNQLIHFYRVFPSPPIFWWTVQFTMKLEFRSQNPLKCFRLFLHNNHANHVLRRKFWKSIGTINTTIYAHLFERYTKPACSYNNNIDSHVELYKVHRSVHYLHLTLCR